MKAAFYEAKGPAREVLRVGDVECPAPLEGELLVRIHASGVNPSDTKRRGTFLGSAMPFSRVIPHQDGAGVVVDIGRNTSREWIGQRVWLYMSQWQRPCGTAAEYAAVPEHRAVPLPPDTEFAEGACLGIPAMTAHRCLAFAGDLQEKNVLVSGAAGAVSIYAIQLAAKAGAVVSATVSTSEQADLARTLGATHLINRRDGNVARTILDATGGRGVDHVVEVAFGENLETNAEVLREGGSIATYASDAALTPVLPFHKLMYKDAKVHFALLYLASHDALQRAANDITAVLRAGALKHVIRKRMPLEDIVRAHEAVEAGHNDGKIVIDLVPG
ncbi:MAG: NADPH:quinone reductase [Steroidobacteraceae bacterium]